MTGNKGKARSLYFGPKSVNWMLLSTEKKRLLETGKTSPPSFKELLQILGRFVQVWKVLSDFWPLCPFLCTSVGFRTLSFDFERFRPISDIIVRFQMAIIRFWIFASVFGHFHPFSNTFRQMLRDHPVACFRPTQDESVRWFLTHLLEPLKLALFKGNLKFTCVRRRWNSLFVYLPLFQGNFQKYTKPDTLRAFHFYFGPKQSDHLKNTWENSASVILQEYLVWRSTSSVNCWTNFIKLANSSSTSW